MDEYVRFMGTRWPWWWRRPEDIALEAMKLIDVKYQVLKPVFTIEEAMAPARPSCTPNSPEISRPTRTT